MIATVAAFILKHTTLSGRTSRSQFWRFTLAAFVLSCLVFATGDLFWHTLVPGWIFYAILLIPATSYQVRRLHDINLSGWWIGLGIIPFFGPIILLLIQCATGIQGNNRFGPESLPSSPR